MISNRVCGLYWLLVLTVATPASLERRAVYASQNPPTSSVVAIKTQADRSSAGREVVVKGTAQLKSGDFLCRIDECFCHGDSYASGSEGHTNGTVVRSAPAAMRNRPATFATEMPISHSGHEVRETLKSCNAAAAERDDHAGRIRRALGTFGGRSREHERFSLLGESARRAHAPRARVRGGDGALHGRQASRHQQWPPVSTP